MFITAVCVILLLAFFCIYLIVIHNSNYSFISSNRREACSVLSSCLALEVLTSGRRKGVLSFKGYVGM